MASAIAILVLLGLSAVALSYVGVRQLPMSFGLGFLTSTMTLTVALLMILGDTDGPLFFTTVIFALIMCAVIAVAGLILLFRLRPKEKETPDIESEA